MAAAAAAAQAPAQPAAASALHLPPCYRLLPHCLSGLLHPLRDNPATAQKLLWQLHAASKSLGLALFQPQPRGLSLLPRLLLLARLPSRCQFCAPLQQRQHDGCTCKELELPEGKDSKARQQLGQAGRQTGRQAAVCTWQHVAVHLHRRSLLLLFTAGGKAGVCIIS